jgi:hypothetical protein
VAYNVEVRPATAEDIQHVSTHLREGDRAEIWASHRRQPEELPQICSGVETWAGAADGVAFCLFGCNPEGMIGVPWLLATDDIRFHSVGFLRASRVLCAEWLTRYGTLSNLVHARNDASILWLQWLGFAFPASVMLNGQKFLRFEKRCKYV